MSMKTNQGNAHILARLPQQYTRAQLIAKSKQLNAAIKNNTHSPKPQARPAQCAGAMVFSLESGGYFCMNCGGDHAA